MKKFVTLILILALSLLAFAACGQDTQPADAAPEHRPADAQEPAEPAAALGDEPVSLVFWHSFADDAGMLIEQIVSDFNAGPGAALQITVDPVYQGKYSDGTTKLNSVLSAESYQDLPDVMNLDATGKVPYYASGVAYTIDDALADDPDYDISQILPVALANWNYAGENLGMPFAASTTLLYYNKTLLDAANAAAPETLADIMALAGKLPAAAADGAPLTIYAAVPNTPTLANWLGQLGSDLVDQHNGTEGTAGELACVDNGALAAFLSEWQALYASGALTNTEGSSDAFVAGQMAIYTTSSSNISSMLEKIGGSFEMGVGYYPKVNADASFGATVSGSCVVMFDKGDALKKQAAWEFVQYLASAEVQAAFAAGTGYTPVNLASADVPAYQALLAEYPQYGVSIDQLNITPPEMRSVTIGPAIDFYYAIQDNITAMLDEGWTVEDAVETMADELNGLLYQYNQSNQ